MAECLTRERPRVWASQASLRCCPWARHIYPSLVLVQPRKTHPCLTERLLMGRKESNQTNKQNMLLMHSFFFVVFFLYVYAFWVRYKIDVISSNVHKCVVRMTQVFALEKCFITICTPLLNFSKTLFQVFELWNHLMQFSVTLIAARPLRSRHNSRLVVKKRWNARLAKDFVAFSWQA